MLQLFKTRWARILAVLALLVALYAAAGFVLAPIFHRVLHRFHVETTKD